MQQNTKNTIYLLQKGFQYETPMVIGLYTDLALLREAIVKVAAPIRRELQRVPAYIPCDDMIWGGEDHLNCDKDCSSCIYFVSPEKYEKKLDDSVKTLHFPYENVTVTVMPADEQPREIVENDGWEDYTEIQPVPNCTYYLFPVKEDTLLVGKVHYVRELFGEEIFDLFTGPLSDLVRERARKEE